MGKAFRVIPWLRMSLLILCWLAISAVIGHAQDPVSGASQPPAKPDPTGFVRDYEELSPVIPADLEPAGWQTALGVIGSLALVVVAIYGTLWGIRAFLLRKGPAAARANWIQVWETVHLSPNRALHLVEVNGRLLFLGATDHQVSLLAELDREAVEEQTPFAARLAQMVDEPMAPGPQTKVGAAFDGLRGVMNRLRDIGRTEGA